MARKKATNKRKELTDSFGFIAPVAAAGQLDLFKALTTSGEDDREAVELTDSERANMGVCYEDVAKLTRKKKDLEAEVKAVSARLIDAKESMLTSMKEQGTKQFRGTDDDGACSIANRYQTKVVDPEAFLQWVLANHSELLSVNANTRTSFIREHFKDKGVPVDSDEFPPGVEATEHEFLQVRGVKSAQ